MNERKETEKITLAVGFVVFLVGCASSPWARAECDRFRFRGYNVIACNDKAVGEHCRRGSRSVLKAHEWVETSSDSGKPLDYYPRACTEFRATAFNRKPTIAIGKSYLACLPHEIAHFENPGSPAWVEENFKCVGDHK